MDVNTASRLANRVGVGLKPHEGVALMFYSGLRVIYYKLELHDTDRTSGL